MSDEDMDIDDPSEYATQKTTLENLANQWYFQHTRDLPPVPQDDDKNRALFQAENYKLAFNFDWTQRIRYINDLNHAESQDYQILCLTIGLGPYRKRLRYTRLDESGRFNLPPLRTYIRKIETDANYIVIASIGDQWLFQCAYQKREDWRRTTICFITWPEEHFSGIIPIVRDKLNVLVKSGHFVSVVLLPSEDYGNRLIEDDFYVNESNAPNEANAILVRANDRVQIVIRDLDVVHHFKVEEKPREGPYHFATEIIFIRGEL